MTEFDLHKKYPVACHTDNVMVGGTFVAIRGKVQNGIFYIPKALEKGAKKIVVARENKVPEEILEQIEKYNAKLEYVKNDRKALSEISAKAFDFPAKKLKFVGVTGTKGKTTTVFLIENLLRTAGYKTAVLSSLKNFILAQEFHTDLTTPIPDYLHAFLDVCVQQGVEWVVVETAAQAFPLYRLNDIKFDGAIFTNISQEHAEFFANMENYFAAKKSIIGHLKPEAPLILNQDDKRVNKLFNEYSNSFLFSCNGHKNQTLNNSEKILLGKITKASIENFECEVNFQNKISKFNIPLIGKFNLENICAAFLFAKLIKLDESIIYNVFKNFPGVLGRMDKHKLSNGSLAFIDSAHTPSSLEAVFKATRPFSKKLIALFGAGGDRDPIKRPQMGAIAAKYCDIVVITSDNPRSEDPQKIITEVFSGIPEQDKNKVFIESDREKAIKLAYKHSTKDSVLLLFGKGPFEYQIVKNSKTPFSEKEILNSL